MTRFAEHDGRGDYPGASFCQEHPPLYDAPVFVKDISDWTSGHPDQALSAHDRAEQLERRVTAQLLLLCGVNRVRGGGKDDLVAATDYDLGDVHMITENIVSALQMQYNDVFRHVSRMLADEDVGLFPDAEYFMVHQPEIIYLDKYWNVVFNGHTIRPGVLTVMSRDLNPAVGAILSDTHLLTPNLHGEGGRTSRENDSAPSETNDDDSTSDKDDSISDENDSVSDDNESASDEDDSASDNSDSKTDDDNSASDGDTSTSDEDDSTSDDDNSDAEDSSSNEYEISSGFTAYSLNADDYSRIIQMSSAAYDAFKL